MTTRQPLPFLATLGPAQAYCATSRLRNPPDTAVPVAADYGSNCFSATIKGGRHLKASSALGCLAGNFSRPVHQDIRVACINDGAKRFDREINNALVLQG